MRAQIFLVLSFVLISSGCAANTTSTSVDAPLASESTVVAPASASQALGGIEGFVVDESLTPIGGANVSLAAGSRSGDESMRGVTDEAGFFAFSLIEPGTYRLTAMVSGFENASALVNVVPGEVVKANIVVTVLPSQVPYVDVFEKNGIFPCAWSAVAWNDGCAPVETLYPYVGEQKNTFDYNITANFKFIVVETSWREKAVTMDYDFYARLEGEKAEDADLVGTGWGKAPVRGEFWPGKHYNGSTTRNTPAVDFPDASEPIVFRTRTYYDGNYQAEINHHLGSVCSLMLLGYCTGVGVAVEARFTNYVSIFMNGVPADVHEYSAIAPE